MVWIRSASNRTITIATNRARLHALLLDVVGCGRLMPGVEDLEKVGDNRYHYRLAPVSNGAVTFTPDYEARFDTTNPDAISWEPCGEHNFRSWGTFRVADGPVPGELTLQIDTRAEAWVEVNPVVVVLLEPFARRENDTVTAAFLDAISNAVTAECAGTR